MEDNAFLRGLDTDPSDDALRLVYADWLDERGDPRGEFLRIAVALGSSSARDSHFPDLLHRLLELRPGVPAAWCLRAYRWLAEDDVREAVFREVMGDGDGVGSRFLQVENNRDPSPYLFARLAERYNAIRPASAADKRGEGIFEKQTGERGCLVSIDGLEWVADGRCDVQGGFFWDGLAAQGNLFRVGLKDNSWGVLEVRTLWIS
jgi:uncharacterized protein (TIGR02996 family)